MWSSSDLAVTEKARFATKTLYPGDVLAIFSSSLAVSLSLALTEVED